MKLFTDLLFLIAYSLLAFSKGQIYSVFDCRGSESWEVDYSNRDEDMRVFQNWIYARQNLCNRELYLEPAPINGIGSSIQYAIKNLITAFELNKIYRPNGLIGRRGAPGKWLWTDDNPSRFNCTFEMPSVDCYFAPLSDCGFRKHPLAKQYRVELNSSREFLESAVQLLPIGPIDTCTMGRIMKKPLQWIHGQFTHYFLRYRHELAADIQARMNMVFPPDNDNTTNRDFATIAVHIRAGKSMTAVDGRVPTNITRYMRHVDQYTRELALMNKTVSTVFLCSSHQDENIISAESMQERFPRNFRYVVLPHATLEGEGEAENKLVDQEFRKRVNPNLREHVAEYFADMEIMVKADVYIGTVSSMYPLVVALRTVRYPERPRNHSGYLDIRMKRPKLFVEGSPLVFGVWHGITNGYFSEGGPSF